MSDLPPQTSVARADRVYPQGLPMEQLVSRATCGSFRRIEVLAVMRTFLITLFFLLMMFLAALFAQEPITLTITPRVAMENPYKLQTFRMLIRIPDHPDNRRMSYGADCGSNVITAQRPEYARMTEKFLEMRVISDCVFQACVHRLVEGRIKPHCVTERVEVKDEGSNRDYSQVSEVPPTHLYLQRSHLHRGLRGAVPMGVLWREAGKQFVSSSLALSIQASRDGELRRESWTLTMFVTSAKPATPPTTTTVSASATWKVTGWCIGTSAHCARDD